MSAPSDAPRRKKKPRGVCDTCGQSFKLLDSGKVPSHRDPFNPIYECKGTLQLPEAVE